MHTRSFVLLLAAILAAPPLAAAGWGAKGAWEPDTDRDVTDGFLQLDEELAKTTDNVVYFNAIQGQCTGYAGCVSTSANPNSALVQSGHQTYPYQARVLLGVWKDCNGDGFVGVGDNALFEYRTELLLGDESRCNAESTPDPIPRNWRPSHNDGEWVREFIPIGWDTGTKTDVNPYNINSAGTRVWQDWNLPENPPTGQCYVTAHPRGTYSSVGGIVKLADCFSKDRVSAVGTQVFGPADWESIEATKNPWGPSSGGSYVDAYDCDDPALAKTQVLGEVYVSAPRAKQPVVADPTKDEGNSIGGTVNHTETGFTGCDRPNKRGSAGDAPYYLEADVANLDGARDQHDQVMVYQEWFRTCNPPSRPCPNNPYTLGRGTDSQLGTRATSTEGTWGGNTITGVSRNPYFDRDSLQPNGVTYTSSYAYLPPETIQAYGLVVMPTTGTYGAEACGANIGVPGHEQNGWLCDAAGWWQNTEDVTSAIIEGRETTIVVTVGQTFHFRDIDCWDESVGALRNQGLGYGAITGTICIGPQ